jgi:hypothetical protein
MALLSSAMRAAAFTGSTEPITTWFAGRQTGRWITQYRPAPAPPQRRSREETRESLAELRRRGAIDEAEHAALSRRMGV